MTGDPKPSVQFDEKGEPSLPFEWQQVQTVIWLVGIVLLAWRGWWWPGILVLVAISGLTQAVIVRHLRQGDEQRVQQAAQAQADAARRSAEESRATALPEQCPGCGAPLTAATVMWTSGSTATCSYCHTTIKATRPTTSKQG